MATFCKFVLRSIRNLIYSSLSLYFGLCETEYTLLKSVQSVFSTYVNEDVNFDMYEFILYA